MVPPSKFVKPPGHDHYPINDFSLTVSKLKGDAAVGLIDVIYNFIEEFGLKGGASTEVGHRAHNPHLQCVFRIKYPREPDSVKTLTKIIKDLVKAYTKSLKDYRVYFMPLTKSQTFALIIGYISKDEGQPHFQTDFEPRDSRGQA